MNHRHVEQLRERHGRRVRRLDALLSYLLAHEGDTTSTWLAVARERCRLFRHVLNLSPARRECLGIDPDGVICVF